MLYNIDRTLKKYIKYFPSDIASNIPFKRLYLYIFIKCLKMVTYRLHIAVHYRIFQIQRKTFNLILIALVLCHLIDLKLY